MNRLFRLPWITLAAALFVTALHAEDTPSPFTLPAPDPLAILALPDGLNQSNVSIAVSKALLEEQWENLGWERNVTTATTVQSKVSIKVFAVATAADVKLYASYNSEKNTSEEKCKKIALRQLGFLEKSIANKLNLTFRKAKGDSIVDQATTN